MISTSYIATFGELVNDTLVHYGQFRVWGSIWGWKVQLITENINITSGKLNILGEIKSQHKIIIWTFTSLKKVHTIIGYMERRY